MAGIYEVTFPDGARISESPRFPIEVACLKLGTVVTVVEVKGDKARITKPVRGWCAIAHIRQKQNGADSKPRSSQVPKIEVGDRCVLIDGRVGTVRYAGTTAFAKGNWFGVALDKPEGKHNGMVKGKRYFDCPPQHGVFVRMNKIAKVKSAKKTGSQSKTNVYVRTPDGNRIGILCAANDDVSQLKYKIESQLAITAGTLVLTFDGQPLADNTNLSGRGLFRNEATVVATTRAATDTNNAGARNGQASTTGSTTQSSAARGGIAQRSSTKTGDSSSVDDKPGRARWYGCWFFEGEESYVDLTLDVGAKRLSGEAVDEDNDNLVINGTVKQDDQGHPKWTFKMTMKGEPTIINVGVLINGRIKGVWKVLDSWGKFEMCPAKNLEQAKNKKTAII